MSYATIDDVFTRYPPIYTLVGSGANQVTSLEISSIYLFDAEAIVNAHLVRRYTIPLPPDQLITKLTADIAIYNTLRERLPKVPDFMQKRYDDSLALLDKLVEGTVVVLSGTVQSSAGDFEAWSNNAGYHPVFSPVLGELEQAQSAAQKEAALNQRQFDVTSP